MKAGVLIYDNLFGVLMITVTEFLLENVTDFCGKHFHKLGKLT
jgi:hypothetical protein